MCGIIFLQQRLGMCVVGFLQVVKSTGTIELPPAGLAPGLVSDAPPAPSGCACLLCAAPPVTVPVPFLLLVAAARWLQVCYISGSALNAAAAVGAC